MPPFTQLRDHGKPDLFWWTANPTTGPTGSTTTWVGVDFDVTVNGKITGIAFYDSWSDPATTAASYAIGQLQDVTSSVHHILVAKHFIPLAASGNKWNYIWFHPMIVASTSKHYRMAVLYNGGGFFRNNAALASPVTHNNIKFTSSWQSTALEIVNIVPTPNTNANALDVLLKT
jgi:hypothetical protein